LLDPSDQALLSGKHLARAAEAPPCRVLRDVGFGS
jgi:hypothetical protein